MDERQIVERMKVVTQSYQKVDILEELKRRSSVGEAAGQQSLKEFVSKGGVYVL
jgi:hypothetical protein